MKKFFSLRGVRFILIIILSVLSVKTASAAECYVSVTNAAELHDGTVFRIVTETEGFDPAVMEMTAGEGFGKTLAEGNVMTLRGDAPPGWHLTGVSCEAAEGASVTETEHGVRVECKDGSAEGVTTCSFTSVRAEEADVPVLSEFGAIGIGILLGLVGAFIVYRRHGPRRWR
ncbi:MAG: hypothetical protein KJ002_13010 [Candidatus Dadabacteria bacterium]|nr:hypothetical protein [Candidatus Dadabacteria bacterium]